MFTPLSMQLLIRNQANSMIASIRMRRTCFGRPAHDLDRLQRDICSAQAANTEMQASCRCQQHVGSNSQLSSTVASKQQVFEDSQLASA
jgi:hypothetical protein